MLALATDLGTAQIVMLPAIGVVAGLLGGLLGIGGGLVMIPAMLLLLGEPYGPGSLHVFKLGALATSIVVSVPAAVRHARAGAVVAPMLRGIVPLGVVGVAGGIWLSSLLGGEHTHVLRRIFGAVMILSVIANVLQQRSNAATRDSGGGTAPIASRWGLIGSVTGIPAGLIAGFLGIGGGIWAVPAQNLLLGIRLRNAIANSSCMIVGVAAAAAAGQSAAVARMTGLSPADGWVLAAGLAPGAVIGGWCGASLTHRISTRGLRWAFHGLLIVAGVRLAAA